MLKSTSLLVLLVLLLLITGAAFAAPPAGDGTQASAVHIKTFLRSDLTLKTVVLVPEPAPAEAGKAAPVAFLKTCRCSCGQPCTTNADCGPGGACGVGITCCNRTPGQNGVNSLNSIFQQNSSSKNPSLAALTVDCKQK